MTRAKRPSLRRRSGPASTRPVFTSAGVADLQKGWWVLGIAGTVVGALGFQTLPPSRRLAAMEQVNVRQDSASHALESRNASQDSVMAEHQRAERLALDSINRRLGQLLAGQCAKERDRMARLLYACARLEP